MVSSFEDKIRGFGYRLLEGELSEVNAYHADRGKVALDASAGTRLLELSAKKGVGQGICSLSRPWTY